MKAWFSSVEVSHAFQNFLSTGSGQNALAEALEDGFAHFEPQWFVIDTKQHELAKPSKQNLRYQDCFYFRSGECWRIDVFQLRT